MSLQRQIQLGGHQSRRFHQVAFAAQGAKLIAAPGARRGEKKEQKFLNESVQSAKRRRRRRRRNDQEETEAEEEADITVRFIEDLTTPAGYCDTPRREDFRRPLERSR